VGASLLDFERSNISGAIASRRVVSKLVDFVRSDEGKAKSRLADSDTLRHELAEDYLETEVGFQYSFRIISMQNRGIIPNYEASTAKMFMSELGQRLARTGTKVFGLHSNIWDEKDARAPMAAQFTRSYVLSVPSTIAGGTSEIQRNIIATRGLGLPRG
jgi:alkylation response protein AidB-like acyl-CoA dehydrogenase